MKHEYIISHNLQNYFRSWCDPPHFINGQEEMLSRLARVHTGRVHTGRKPQSPEANPRRLECKAPAPNSMLWLNYISRPLCTEKPWISKSCFGVRRKILLGLATFPIITPSSNRNFHLNLAALRIDPNCSALANRKDQPNSSRSHCGKKTPQVLSGPL